MKIVYNNLFPVKGYVAMCVFPFIFVRKDTRRLSVTTIRHETIHGEQQKELLLIVFYLWYGLEFVIRWCAYGFNHNMAYKNISFEQEAYQNQNDENYLLQRKHYAFIKYLLKKSYK